MILSVFLLQGCDDKNDTPVGVGKGKLLHNSHVYQLYNAYLIPPPITDIGITLDFERYESYSHRLILTGVNWGISATITVRTIRDRLESGKFHVDFWTLDNQVVFRSGGYPTYFPPVQNNPYRLTKQIILTDDFVHFAHNFGASPKRMKLTITEEEGGIFDIELRYVECEGDFFIRYRGLIKDRWW